MLPRLLLCGALIFALCSVRGSAQPARCANTMTLSNSFTDVIVELGMVNCFTCSQATSWTATDDNDNNIPIANGGTLMIGEVTVVEVENNYLVLPDPGAYVMPGSGGRRNIICTNIMGITFEARLTSPELVAPSFFPEIFIVSEFTPLTINCINRVPPAIGTVQIFNPAGEMVGFLSYTVPNITRQFAGNYSCVVTSQRSNATKSTSAEVIIQFAPEITPANVTSHQIFLGAELRLACGYVGVPEPDLQWIQNGTIVLTNNDPGVAITGDGEGDTTFSIVIDTVGRDSGGTYTCRANNTLGADQYDYTVLILIPPAPITNPMVVNVGEREVSLSWMTGFDGFTPITGVTVDITPERGTIADTSREVGIVNSTTIRGLEPFRSYDFNVSVVNEAGASDPVTITASTLSLMLGVPQDVTLMAESSTNLVLTWNAPIFDADTTDDPNFYIIEFSLDDDNILQTLNISSAMPLSSNFTGLDKGTFYQATVTAYNDVGAGDTSQVVRRETLIDPPSMPTELMVEGVGAEVLRVMWNEPTDNGGRPLSAYRIAIDDVSYSADVDSDMREVLLRDIGLVENTTYIVAVSASNAAQGFGPNATAMGTTQSITLPQTIFDIPMPIRERTTNRSAVFSWVNPGGTVDLYLVEYVLAVDGFNQGAVMSLNVSGNDTSVEVRNLLPGSSYDFRVAVINSQGRSAFSVAGMVTTRMPDPPVITSSHPDGIVPEGTTIMLNCTVTLEDATFRWEKDGQALPASNMFDVNFQPDLKLSFLRIIMPAEGTADGTYTCIATAGSNEVSASFELEITPTQETGIDQNVIIIVASVGGAALLIFVVVVFIAVCCLCVMRSKNKKGNYGLPLKERNKPNANWIETSTQFVPATGNTDGPSASDRLAFDYSVDLQTHSSFNTMEKQRVHAVDNQYVNVAPETNGHEGSPSYVNAPATEV